MTELAPWEQFDNVDLWLDEEIWGHRLYDEQTPWLCFLEFLAVLINEEKKGTTLMLEGREPFFKYHVPRRLPLRVLLFSNPKLQFIMQAKLSDGEAWDRWHTAMREVTRENKRLAPMDFTYLQDRFSSFADFGHTLELLRSSAIEEQSNKRWTSKFVFPFGPDCIYADLSASTLNPDRRFFGRTGEILYLMLARSARNHEIADKLGGTVLQRESAWNRLVLALSDGVDPAQDVRKTKIGYLPPGVRQEYEDLAEDWSRLLTLQLPEYDVLRHLVTIAGLHLIRYQLTRAREELAFTDPVRFVLEISAPTKTPVRELSVNRFSENSRLTRQALEARIQSTKDTHEWQEACKAAEPGRRALELLTERYHWTPRPDAKQGIRTPDDALEAFTRQAINRHKQHFANFHRVYARNIGLGSSRGSQRLRYAPTDELLKTLVLTTVNGRMEYKRFLAQLAERYGLIIGDHEAAPELELGDADGEDFAENALRLERRLQALGLLKRLSDACAYVMNPTGQHDETR